MQVIIAILVIIIVIGAVLQIGWMGIAWFWAVAVRALHMPVAAVVAAFLTFRAVSFFLKSADTKLRAATVLSVIAGCLAAWLVVNMFYDYSGYGPYSLSFRDANKHTHYIVPVFEGIEVRYLIGVGGEVMSQEDSINVAYFLSFLAVLITVAKQRRQRVSSTELEERRRRVLSSVRDVMDTLILLSYGEYIRSGRRIDIVFVVLPLAGVAALLVGLWMRFVGQ